MRKILTGFMGLVMVSAVVGGVAYAAFTDEVQVNGVAITTGNPNLLFNTTNAPVNDASWVSSFTLPAALATNVVPGFKDYTEFYLQNKEESDVTFSLTARLVNADGSTAGSWEALNSVAEVLINEASAEEVGGSGYFNLLNWNAAPKDINVTLAPGQVKQFRIYLNVPSSAGNSIAGKNLVTSWVITGTQVIPAPLP